MFIVYGMFTVYYYIVYQLLQINPHALLPGATPPSKAPQETAVSFDQPAQAKTLTSMTKVRKEGLKEFDNICITSHIMYVVRFTLYYVTRIRTMFLITMMKLFLHRFRERGEGRKQLRGVRFVFVTNINTLAGLSISPINIVYTY